MAPRRRSIKKGETRMDAALDAMEPFGFSRKLTRSTVHTLLKVYGGTTEGWVFIEDSGYSLLIDRLLENQANSSPRDNMIEDNPGDGPDEAMDTASATSENDYQLSSNGVYTVSAATSELGTELPSKGVETVSATSELGSLLPLKSVDIASVTSDLGSQPFIKAAIKEEKEYECHSAENFSLVENHGSKSQQLVTKRSHRKRKPCHGWISDDDEELIVLPLAPLPIAFTP